MRKWHDAIAKAFQYRPWATKDGQWVRDVDVAATIRHIINALDLRLMGVAVVLDNIESVMNTTLSVRR
jgi:hypothetical protein